MWVASPDLFRDEGPTVTIDHGYTEGTAPVWDVHGDDLPRASGADHARTLAASQTRATLSTLALDPPGHPFGSVVSYVLDDGGHPLMVISTMAEHTRNAAADGRASLLVSEPVGEGADPLASGRITLLGTLARVPDDAQDAATAAVVAALPGVGLYASFSDFACWRLEVTHLRWVGGFGRMSWIGVDDYLRATVDPVLPHAAGIVDHMNADHAAAGLLLCAQAAGRDDLVSATMVRADRFGCDYEARAADGVFVSTRIPFPEPAGGVDDVRRHLVAAVRAVRGSDSTR
jgi:heme iron utilization protein